MNHESLGNNKEGIMNNEGKMIPLRLTFFHIMFVHFDEGVLIETIVFPKKRNVFNVFPWSSFVPKRF